MKYHPSQRRILHKTRTHRVFLRLRLRFWRSHVSPCTWCFSGNSLSASYVLSTLSLYAQCARYVLSTLSFYAQCARVQATMSRFHRALSFPISVGAPGTSQSYALGTFINVRAIYVLPHQTCRGSQPRRAFLKSLVVWVQTWRG